MNRQTPGIIRPYTPADYQQIKSLYQTSGWFDAETDAKERLNQKSKRDPQSLLVYEDNGSITGTLSIIEDGRIAWFFRLVADNEQTLHQLLTHGQILLKERGYNEVHIFSPEPDTTRQSFYEKNGFTRGNPYRWYWKKLPKVLV